MADGVEVPIKLPTDASGVEAAKKVVGGLQDALKGLGPAAAAGAKQAADAMKGLGKSAGVQRDAQGRFLPKGARGVSGKGPGPAPTTNDKAAVAAHKAELKRIRDAKKAAFEAKVAASEKAKAKTLKIEAKAQQKAQAKADAAAARGSGFSADALIGGAATAALAAVTALYAAVGVLAVKFTAALVAVQAFREATLGAFSKLLGGAKAADAAFRQTIKTADDIGIGYKEALSGVNNLIAKGFKADQAQELVKAMSDLKSVSPDANIGNLLLAIGQIKSKGRVAMEELRGQIAEAGLDISVVLAEIGKPIKKSAQEVEKLIAAGKISSEQGVQGILAAIQKITGKPIGEAAKEAANSLGGLIKRVEQVPEGLLMMADSSKGVSVLKDALRNVLGAFGPSTKGGQALSAAFGKLGDAASTFLSGLTGKKGGDALQSFATGIAGVLDSVAAFASKVGSVAGPVLGGFIKGLGDGLNAGNKTGKGAADNTAVFVKLGEALGKAAEALGKLIGMLVGAKAASEGAQGTSGGILDDIVGKVEQALALYNAISTAAANVKAAAVSIGTNLVAGIIQGLSLASPGLAAAVAAVAQMTTATAQSAHQIKSPSREWRDDVGYQLGAGEAAGVYDAAPLVQRAVADMAGATTAAGRGAVAGSPLATTAGRSMVVNLTVNVDGSSGGSSLAAMIARAVRSELEALA